jgi:hypothetical protein
MFQKQRSHSRVKSVYFFLGSFYVRVNLLVSVEINSTFCNMDTDHNAQQSFAINSCLNYIRIRKGPLIQVAFVF